MNQSELDFSSQINCRPEVSKQQAGSIGNNLKAENEFSSSEMMEDKPITLPKEYEYENPKLNTLNELNDGHNNTIIQHTRHLVPLPLEHGMVLHHHHGGQHALLLPRDAAPAHTYLVSIHLHYLDIYSVTVSISALTTMIITFILIDRPSLHFMETSLVPILSRLA